MKANRPQDSWARGLEGKTLTLIIGKYRVRSYSPTGRATKGYFAYVMGQNRLVFVKISWRPETTTVTRELDRYAALYEAKVPHIAILVGGGDTSHVSKEAKSRGKSLELRTRTQELLGITMLYPRVQTRLVFETLGIPLSEYEQPASLACVVRDALKGERSHTIGLTSILTGLVSSSSCLERCPDSSPRYQYQQYSH